MIISAIISIDHLRAIARDYLPHCGQCRSVSTGYVMIYSARMAVCDRCRDNSDTSRTGPYVAWSSADALRAVQHALDAAQDEADLPSDATPLVSDEELQAWHDYSTYFGPSDD
jgi:ribosome-binding protein aMBF1 (putative translation factor)